MKEGLHETRMKNAFKRVRKNEIMFILTVRDRTFVSGLRAETFSLSINQEVEFNIDHPFVCAITIAKSEEEAFLPLFGGFIIDP